MSTHRNRMFQNRFKKPARESSFGSSEPRAFCIWQVFFLSFLLLAMVWLEPAADAAGAADFRKMADQSVAQGQYARAADYYRQEASVYRQKGDVNAAKVEENKADRWTTEIQVFAAEPAEPKIVASLDTHAKFEPTYGCYFGAYVEADDRLQNRSGPNDDPVLPEQALGDMVHKTVATSFTYCHYGEQFPLRWATALVAKGIAPHVALEPNDGMEAVQDDDYLQKFAADAASCSSPVFLRFAGEMNGDWTVYHRDPVLYRQKFKLVHDVMARLAPNVAMIWCVNSIPEYNMDEYYPGDDAVDWVGVNFYSVLHHDNDPHQPAWFENPIDSLKYTYSHYASRKPIAICEYGASHQEQLAPDEDRSDVAATKLAQLYSALPLQFPRVKLIDIFDCNNLDHARPGRKFNNYSITDSSSVLAAFTRAIASPFYLSKVVSEKQTDLPPYNAKISAGATIRGTTHVSSMVKCYDDHPTVIYAVDGKEAARISDPGDYGFELDTSKYGEGKHQLSVRVVDSKGNQAGDASYAVVFAAAEKPPAPPPSPPAASGSGVSKPVEIPPVAPTPTPAGPLPFWQRWLPGVDVPTFAIALSGIGLIVLGGLFVLIRLSRAVRSR